MINFVLVGDENAHVCEVQLAHKKMLLQRKEMVRPSRLCPLVIATSPRGPPPAFSPSDDPQQDGHLYYGRVRIATEVLEKLRFLGSSERLTRVKELHAAGTTTAAALKHIGGMTPLDPHVPRACALLTVGHPCFWQCPSPTCCMAGSLPTSCALPAIQRCVGMVILVHSTHSAWEAGSSSTFMYRTQAEILAVLSPAERLRAAQACHELVPNAAQPSEAETLAGYLNHALLRTEAVAALLSAKGAVAKLMSLAADATVPAEARVLIMNGVIYRSSPLTRAAFREGGALDKCLAILASTDAPQLVHVAARKMLGAAADRADVVRREDAIAQLALQPGSDAAGAARTLANIAGRREALGGSTVFDGGYLLRILQTKPGALKALVTWLQAAPPEQAAHLAVVVAAIAPHGDDARLLNVGVIAALLSPLPAASSAEALALIAASPLGQERLWQANAIPKLLEVAIGKDHSAAVHAARAIGSLAVHATGRDAMGKLVASAKESDAALQLLGEAMRQNAAAPLAAEAHGALELLRIAMGKQGVSATAVLAAARMAVHGTRAQILALVGAGVVEAAAVVLQRSNVSREEQSSAWRALSYLIPAADEARERAREDGVVELLSSAFERADAAALWALRAMGVVARSNVDATAIVEAGLTERAAALIVATEDDTAREVAHLAAAQLAHLVQGQKGVMETEARNRVAVAALRPAIALVQAPSHIHFGHDASELLNALASSERGVSTTKQALNDVLEDPLARFNKANLLSKTGLLGKCFDLLGTDKDGAGKRLLHVLQEVTEPADQLALLCVLRCLPGAANPRPLEGGGMKIVQHLLETSNVAVTASAAAHLRSWATQPGVVADVLASGGITRLTSMIKQNGEAKDVDSPAETVLALLQAAEAAGNVTKLANAVVNEGMLAVLTSRLDQDGWVDSRCTASLITSLGLLACTKEGMQAVEELISSRSVFAMAVLVSIKQGMDAAAACDALGPRLERMLTGKESLSDRERRYVCNVLSSLDKGGERGRKLLQSLMPHVASVFKDVAAPLKLRNQCITDVFYCCGMSGSDGLRALSDVGIFEELFTHLRETRISGSYHEAAKKVCGLLQTALTDEATAEAARRIIARIAESMPPETDALDASDARLAASLIKQLSPINANAKIAATKQVLLDAGVLPKLLKALDQDEWSVLRSSLRQPVASAVSGLIDETAGDGLARFCALGGATALARLIERSRGDEIASYIQLCQSFSISPDDRLRDDFIQSGMLDALAKVAEAGPSEPGYFMVVCTLQLLSLFGTDEHRSAVRDGKALGCLIGWLNKGRLAGWEKAKNRTLDLVSIFADVSEASDAVQDLVTRLGGDIGTAATAAKQLAKITSSPLKFAGAKVVHEKKALPGLLALLKSDEHATAHEAALDCVYNLAMHNASSAKEATRACVRLIEKKLSEGTRSTSACHVLSALASASTAATSAICAMVNRIFEKEDAEGVDESHATLVVDSLRHMCHLPASAAAACKAGLIAQAETAAASAKSRDLRRAVLGLLTSVAAVSEAARPAMRDSPTIAVAVQYIADGIKSSAEKHVGTAALELLLVLSQSESLRGAIRAASLLDSLESLCNTSSKERTTALLLVANVYASLLDLPSSHAGSDAAATSERVVALVTKYSIEQELTTMLSESIRRISRDPPGLVLGLRTSLAAVRSLATSAQLCPRLVEAGVAEALARALSTVETHPLGATAADLSVAADAIQRLAFVEELRPRLLNKAVTDALSSRLSGSDQSEGGQRLEQAAKSALATLNGELDIVISHDCIDAGGVAPEKAPRYNVFISHKRSDAQDFARGLCTRAFEHAAVQLDAKPLTSTCGCLPWQALTAGRRRLHVLPRVSRSHAKSPNTHPMSSASWPVSGFPLALAAWRRSKTSMTCR